MRSQHLLLVVAIAAVAGAVFSGFSTYDFAAHLDRQVHGVHCSFAPGIVGADASGASGCQVAMMSPYSSVLRAQIWGGIPIALPSLSVFAFLLFFAAELYGARRLNDRLALGLLLLATALPSVVSVIMAAIAISELGALCKLCTGIYIASFAALAAAFTLWRRAPRRSRFADDEASLRSPVVTNGYLAAVCFAGVLFVAAPVLAYVGRAPDHDELIIGCGVLSETRDRYRVMLDLDDNDDGVPVIELLDPLCPACAAFERRFSRYGGRAALHRRAVLFPLDNACNWMVDTTIHPGACTVSEALLCAGDAAPEVLRWAFAEAEAIREASTTDPRAARRLISERFPRLRSCIGSARARARLNRSLRWAVGNRLPVSTPQLFVAGVAVCEEDLDLGYDYALALLRARYAAGTLPRPKRRPAFVRPGTAAASAAAADAGGSASAETGAAAAGESDAAAPAGESDDAVAAGGESHDTAAAAGESDGTVAAGGEPNDAAPAGESDAAAPPAVDVADDSAAGASPPEPASGASPPEATPTGPTTGEPQ